MAKRMCERCDCVITPGEGQEGHDKTQCIINLKARIVPRETLRAAAMIITDAGNLSEHEDVAGALLKYAEYGAR